jgi:hypothetical protein
VVNHSEEAEDPSLLADFIQWFAAVESMKYILSLNKNISLASESAREMLCLRDSRMVFVLGKPITNTLSSWPKHA